MIVCSFCGNTKAEARRDGSWLHEHEWVRWTGLTHALPDPLGLISETGTSRLGGTASVRERLMAERIVRD